MQLTVVLTRASVYLTTVTVSRMSSCRNSMTGGLDGDANQ